MLLRQLLSSLILLKNASKHSKLHSIPPTFACSSSSNSSNSSNNNNNNNTSNPFQGNKNNHISSTSYMNQRKPNQQSHHQKYSQNSNRHQHSPQDQQAQHTNSRQNNQNKQQQYQQKKGFLTQSEQNELKIIFEAIKSPSTSDELCSDDEGDSIQQQPSTSTSSSGPKIPTSTTTAATIRISAIQKFHPSYNPLSEQSYLKLLQFCSDVAFTNSLPLSTIGLIILELGRNPHRNTHAKYLRIALSNLCHSFQLLNPLPRLIEHIKFTKRVNKFDFSYIEFTFLRDIMPQLLISLQNCQYYVLPILNDYFVFISHGGFESSGIFLKNVLSILWTYLKFRAFNVPEQEAFEHFFTYIDKRWNYLYFQMNMRLLWVCAMHPGVASESQLNSIKSNLLTSLAKQKIVIYNSKNATQILQILIALYPQSIRNEQLINQRNTTDISEVKSSGKAFSEFEKDLFYQKLQPCVEKAQEVLRARNETKNSQMVLIHNTSMNKIDRFVKPRREFESKFEKNVITAIQSMSVNDLKIKQKLLVADAFEVDILLEDHAIAIEVNGASHYYFDTDAKQFRLFPNFESKVKSLKLFGINHVVSINQFDWESIKTLAGMQQHIRERFTQAGLNESDFFCSPSQVKQDQSVEFFSDNLRHLQSK